MHCFLYLYNQVKFLSNLPCQPPLFVHFHSRSYLYYTNAKIVSVDVRMLMELYKLDLLTWKILFLHNFHPVQLLRIVALYKQPRAHLRVFLLPRYLLLKPNLQFRFPNLQDY